MSDKHFNNLTPAQAERLAMLAEECGEVIQIVGKILRHGYDSEHPITGKGNRQLLQKELCDVFAVAAQLHSDGVKGHSVDDLFSAWKKKLMYSHHQEPRP